MKFLLFETMVLFIAKLSLPSPLTFAALPLERFVILELVVVVVVVVVIDEDNCRCRTQKASASRASFVNSFFLEKDMSRVLLLFA
jgi:uncharacterized membrane protein